MGLREASALRTSSIIGATIFIVPGILATGTGSPYVYVRDASGEFIGFPTGWALPMFHGQLYIVARRGLCTLCRLHFPFKSFATAGSYNLRYLRFCIYKLSRRNFKSLPLNFVTLIAHSIDLLTAKELWISIFRKRRFSVQNLT
jgi:hypothetical protein